MAIKGYLFVALVVLAFWGCTKAALTPATEFEIELPPNQAYTKVIETLLGQGFFMERADNASLSATTQWRELSLEKLKEAAELGDDEIRVERGRYGYQIRVTEREGKTMVYIEAAVEGLFLPKQRGTEGRSQAEWHKEKSKGNLERALMESVSKS